MKWLLILFGLFSFLAYFWGTKYEPVLFFVFISTFFIVEALADRDEKPQENSTKIKAKE